MGRGDVVDVVVQEVDGRGRIGLKLVAKHENGGLVMPEELIERAKDARLARSARRPRGGRGDRGRPREARAAITSNARGGASRPSSFRQRQERDAVRANVEARRGRA